MLAADKNPITAGRPLERRAFEEIRRTMELHHHKWDAQLGDVTTLAPFPLLLDTTTYAWLARRAETLFEETRAMEEEIAGRPELHRLLGVPRRLRSLLQGDHLAPTAARVMRFDFHFTTEGWRVSEVNSDVPGGFTEATSFARLMAVHAGARPTGNPADALVDALCAGRQSIALLSAAGHMEDHQVVAHIAARIEERGLDAHVVTLQTLRWRGQHAYVGTHPVDAVYRFYQAEWLDRASAEPLLVTGATPVCNPAPSLFTESKRLPLVWDRLRCRPCAWPTLLPQTVAVADAAELAGDCVLKPAYGNTGDDVALPSTVSALGWMALMARARLQRSRWVVQRRFHTVPVVVEGKRLYPCLGIYVINGTAAGTYGRLSPKPVIDAFALDAAVLIRE